MAVKQTSKAALDQLVLSGLCTLQIERIYEYLTYTKATRREIAKDLGIDLSAVCGRVNSLVKSGCVEVTKVRACLVTRKMVEELAAINQLGEL